MKQKELTELSLDELWQLFPIILTAHQDCWAEWYKEEAELLKEQLSYAKRISHIGSTAIKGIWAKPTIDILVEISREEKIIDLKNAVEKCSYICMAENIVFLEVLKNLDKLTQDTFFMSYSPLPIYGLDSCPIRAYAIEGLAEFSR